MKNTIFLGCEACSFGRHQEQAGCIMTDVGFALALQQLELRAHVHSAYLSRGARPGPAPRGPSDLRPLVVTAGVCPPDFALGSAEVRLGATHITCGITALVGSPVIVEDGVATPPRGDIGAYVVICT